MTALPTIFRRLLSTVFNSFTTCPTEKRSASTLTILTVPRRMTMQRHSSPLANARSSVKSEPSRYLRRFGFAKSARRGNVHKRRDYLTSRRRLTTWQTLLQSIAGQKGHVALTYTKLTFLRTGKRQNCREHAQASAHSKRCIRPYRVHFSYT
jgi:hypothetical protein